MPLHLLGKKSWNIYNPESIARVRRDEAAARAREAESEKHLRDNEVEDRLARLRSSGHNAGPLDEDIPRATEASRKRRKIAGVDDADRDIRLAGGAQPQVVSEDTSVTLFDRNGHIDLIQESPPAARVQGQSRAQHADTDEPGVRLSDASGRDPGSAKPWYSSTSADGGYALETVSRNVWGNEDAGRIQRNKQRIAANDPLASMKRGVKQLREAEDRRKEWMHQRERDLNEVEELARKERKRRKCKRKPEEESLDNFELDDGCIKQGDRGHTWQSEDEHRPRRHHRHHRRRRTRSRSPRRGRD